MYSNEIYNIVKKKLEDGINVKDISEKLAKENSSSTIREEQMDVLVDKDIANYQISIELMFEVLKDIYDAIRKPVLSGQLSELNIKDENDTTEL